MPRGRIVLKSITQAKRIALLKTDSARLLFTWLIPHLDIAGNFSAEPEIINGVIFTRLRKTPTECQKHLDDLEAADLIIRYQANGELYLHVPDFIEKQPNLRADKEADPTGPECPKDLISEWKSRRNSGPTPGLLRTNSGVARAKPGLSKVKRSKVKTSKQEEEAPDQKNPDPTPPVKKINFNFETRKWENITKRDVDDWKEAYPAIDVRLHVLALKEWLISNPANKKSNYRRFITNNLSRAQDKARTLPAGEQPRDKNWIKDWISKGEEKE